MAIGQSSSISPFAIPQYEDKVLMEHSFYEFFAGGGMARAGLGSGWNCLFANDFDHKKGKVYRFNWGDNELMTADIWSLGTDDIPSTADLAWASFPCQDLSLAGGGAGPEGRPVRYVLAVLEPDDRSHR